MGTMIARSISVVSMAGTRARSGQPETCCRAAHPTISLAFKVPPSLAAGRAKAGYRAPLRRVLRSSTGRSCHSRVTKGERTGRQRQARASREPAASALLLLARSRSAFHPHKIRPAAGETDA
jgi:hypothetical protein